MGKYAPPSILQVFGNFFSERFTLKRENARRGTTPPGPERTENALVDKSKRIGLIPACVGGILKFIFYEK